MSNRIKRESAIRRLASDSLYSNFPLPKHSQNKPQKNEKFESYKQLEPKVLAQKLIELENVFNFHRSVLQSVTTGILTLDMAGNITYANRPAADILAVEMDELIRKSVADFFPTIDVATMFDKLPLRDIEAEYSRNPKEQNFFRLHLDAYTDVANNHSGVILSIENISEIVFLREQMERMDRLATLGEVSAGIAHEIRNPLAGAKSIAQVLDSLFEGKKEVSEYTGRIVREIDRANVLLQEFFKFAKPEKPKQSFVDTEAFIEQAIRRFMLKDEFKSIQFKTDFSQLTPHFYADRGQVDVVLSGIVQNAVEAMSKSDERRIKITARKFEKSRKKVITEFVAIEVEDTGIGIPEHDLEKIFNPFFTTKPSNVGLNLSIASRLIESNGGEIKVRNNKHLGCTFILLLPTR